jgi:dTDP-4-dehydrorhamnose 3,5-epimerase
MIINYAVPVGGIKLVLYDDREGSASRGTLEEHYLGAGIGNYALMKVPIGVWNGFKGIGVGPALVANCASIPHDPTEITRLDPFDPSIPYDWALRHR